MDVNENKENKYKSFIKNSPICMYFCCRFLILEDIDKEPKNLRCLDHSFVEKVMDIFKDEVNKIKIDFQNEMNEDNIETIMKKFVLSTNEKLDKISSELDYLKAKMKEV